MIDDIRIFGLYDGGVRTGKRHKDGGLWGVLLEGLIGLDDQFL